MTRCAAQLTMRLCITLVSALLVLRITSTSHSAPGPGAFIWMAQACGLNLLG